MCQEGKMLNFQLQTFILPYNRFLLYGANGCTGRLITGYAAQYGLELMLAGRMLT